MELSQRDLGDVTVLDVSGRLTLSDGSGQLKDKVTSLVAAGRTNIVLNLANLSYMDSAGLGEMVACYTTATKVRWRGEDREHHRQDEGSAHHHQARHRVRFRTTLKPGRSAVSAADEAVWSRSRW